MAGANPDRTHQLLDRSLHRRRFNDDDISTNQSAAAATTLGGQEVKPSDNAHISREHADALLLAYKHLGGQSLLDGDRTNMLTEAARCYEKLGDGRAISDCRFMLSAMAKDDQRTM